MQVWGCIRLHEFAQHKETGHKKKFKKLTTRIRKNLKKNIRSFIQ